MESGDIRVGLLRDCGLKEIFDAVDDKGEAFAVGDGGFAAAGDKLVGYMHMVDQKPGNAEGVRGRGEAPGGLGGAACMVGVLEPE